ncbi:MAG TPA: AzlC family ABC transporter permease [Ktedonobacterales bacterium]|nr:AzlC family ABC transporter permease [Ktedonobacterales bacterium]
MGDGAIGKVGATRAGEFWAGARAEIPLIVGAAPFGLIYGVTAIGAHLGAGLAVAMSSIVFAGSAQFIVAQLIGLGAPAVVIVITGAIVNLRHALYSASLAPYLDDLRPAWKRWLLAYLLTDEAYAITVIRYRTGDRGPYRHWFFLGAGLALWSAWQVSTATGVFLGASIPASWNLDFALPLTFIALVAPVLRDRANITVALVAGTLALLVGGLPLKVGLIVAILVAVAAGMLWPSRKDTAKKGKWDGAQPATADAQVGITDDGQGADTFPGALLTESDGTL